MSELLSQVIGPCQSHSTGFQDKGTTRKFRQQDICSAVLFRNKDHLGNDGRSNVLDCLEFKIVSNSFYPNCSRNNCYHFVVFLENKTGIWESTVAFELT